MGLQKPRKQHWKMESGKLCKAARMWSKNSDYTIGRFYLQGAMISQTLKTESMLKKIYSGLPHKRVHPNKQAGRGNFEFITWKIMCGGWKDFFNQSCLFIRQVRVQSKNKKMCLKKITYSNIWSYFFKQKKINLKNVYVSL